MLVIYSPEDGDTQQWEFTARKVRVLDAERIERRYDAPFAQWADDINKGVMSARRILLWHLLARTHKGYRWDDTPDFAVGEIEIKLTRDEIQLMREKAEGSTDLEPEIREMLLAALDAQIEAAPEVPGVEAGKALSSDAASG